MNSSSLLNLAAYLIPVWSVSVTRVRQSGVAADDEDLPVTYLLYIIAAMIVIAAAAVSSFVLFVN